MPARLERIKALPGFTVEDGQHKRGSARLALIALAGELATEYGITGWSEGAAIAAAKDALKCWQELRGAGPSEKRQVLAQVSTFIDRHGDGRFSGTDAPENVTLRDRAGWWRDGDGNRVYLFNGDGMHQALKGFDFSRGLDHLQEAGALIDCGNNRRSKSHRIKGRIVRLYSIDPDKLGVIDGS
jgi:putative DNA primase/helicase